MPHMDSTFTCIKHPSASVSLLLLLSWYMPFSSIEFSSFASSLNRLNSSIPTATKMLHKITQRHLHVQENSLSLCG